MPRDTAIHRALSFTEAEYRERLQRVRARMDAAGMGVLVALSPENICYLSGYRTPGYYFPHALVVTPSGDPVLIARSIEMRNVDAFSFLDPGRTVGVDQIADFPGAVISVLADLGLDKGPVGIELAGMFLSVVNHRLIEAGLPQARLVEGSGIVEAERAVKSDAEIAHLRAACLLADAGMQTVADHCRPGMTENALAGRIYEAVYAGGGEFAGSPIVLGSGWRTWVPHALWTDKVIEAGDDVLVEIPGVVERYVGVLYRTFFIGKADARTREVASKVSGILDAAIDALRPGNTSHDVAVATADTGNRVGLPAVRKRAGYSVGLNFPPDWGEGHFLELKEGDPTVLQPNMVFHLPPLVRLPGMISIGVSETVRVTEGAPEILTSFPRSVVEI